MAASLSSTRLCLQSFSALTILCRGAIFLAMCYVLALLDVAQAICMQRFCHSFGFGSINAQYIIVISTRWMVRHTYFLTELLNSMSVDLLHAM
jgi:hypothetical protein